MENDDTIYLRDLSFVHWLGIIVTGCIVLIFIFADPDKKDTEISKQETWMAHGQLSVKKQLKDPGSAEFRNVYFNRGADNMPMTCGEVNSKNSLGGYSGYQLFISAGKPELTFLQEQVPDFLKLWERYCK